jgi:hypothetical protein
VEDQGPRCRFGLLLSSTPQLLLHSTVRRSLVVNLPAVGDAETSNRRSFLPSLPLQSPRRAIHGPTRLARAERRCVVSLPLRKVPTDTRLGSSAQSTSCTRDARTGRSSYQLVPYFPRDEPRHPSRASVCCRLLTDKDSHVIGPQRSCLDPQSGRTPHRGSSGVVKVGRVGWFAKGVV